MGRIPGLLITLVGFALFSGCAKLELWRRSEAPAAADGLRAGVAAPELDGVDFEGRPLKLSDYRGKVVVVAFWSSDCRPCRDMIPYERALAERHRDRPFAMLGVNLDENPERARHIISSHGITWRCLQTGGWQNPVAQRWKVSAIPTLFVIDAKGTVRHANVHGPSLDRAVETLLAEAEPRRR